MSSIRKREWLLIFLLVIVFLAIRLPNLHYPYHQDEYKWVYYSHETVGGVVPHPPLTEFIYTKFAPIFGDNNFRAIPLIAGVIDLLLVIWLSSILFKEKKWWAVFLFIVSFYSVLATLMVDVDGAVMPMFMLLLFIGYYKLKNSEWKDLKWIVLIALGAVGGFLIKVSGALPIAALALDFAIEMKVFSDVKKLIRYVLYAIAGAVLLVLILLGSKFIFPFFNLSYSLKYWEHFGNSSSFLGRGWLQTFIQFAKSTLYLSPLLVLPIFFSTKEIFKKLRPFFLFIFIGLIFYLIVFDFSLGALDRYLQFLIIPACFISGAVFSTQAFSRKNIITFSIISVALFLIQFIHNSTPPLYPKTEWLHRMLSLKWNFLYPFNGGSGPLPFYVSFTFIGLSWFVLVLLSLLNRKKASAAILCIGLLYNIVFAEEYLFGKINGSAQTLVKSAAAFIATDADIKQVTVYNDNGGFNIQQTGKYHKRLYIDPKFNIVDKVTTLNQFKEHYLVVDIPHIDPNTVYAKYFSFCKVIFDEQSGYIISKIYDCRKAPDVKI